MAAKATKTKKMDNGFMSKELTKSKIIPINNPGNSPGKPSRYNKIMKEAKTKADPVSFEPIISNMGKATIAAATAWFLIRVKLTCGSLRYLASNRAVAVLENSAGCIVTLPYLNQECEPFTVTPKKGTAISNRMKAT